MTNIVNPNSDDDMETIIQQFYDADLAMAINESSTTFENELKKAQEDADAELARQFAEQDNPSPIGDDAGDDINDILEQIACAEAKEKLKKEGNAYRRPINIDNIMQIENKEEELIKQQIENEYRLKQWRAERSRQDAEYQESERLDKLKSQSAPMTAPMPAPMPAVIEEVPKSREELRLIRLAYLNKQASM
jgi:hypothetical protein